MLSQSNQARGDFTTSLFPSCSDVGRCGRNSGTVANADERLMLAVFNYDELYKSIARQRQDLDVRLNPFHFHVHLIWSPGCARSPAPRAHHAVLPDALRQGIFEAAAPVATCVGVIVAPECPCRGRSPKETKEYEKMCASQSETSISHNHGRKLYTTVISSQCWVDS